MVEPESPPTIEWNNSRKGPVVKQRPAQPENIFSGHSFWEQGSIGNVALKRLSVSPSKKIAVPNSFAVIENPVLEPTQTPTLPWEMRWQQSFAARFDIDFAPPANAKFFGLGERFSGLNLRGALHTLCSTDNPDHNESSDSLYKSIPVMYAFDGELWTALFLDSPAPQRWDLDSELDGHCRIELLSRRGWQLYILGSASLPELLDAYTKLTGRGAMPPRWALGHFQCRWSYPDEKVVEAIAQEFRSRKIPCDAIVLDIDYMDEYRVFTQSKERFPNFKNMIAKLAEQDFKLVTIVDPGIKQDPEYDLFKEGLAHEHFCRNAKGEIFIDEVWPGLSAFPDFIQEKTRQWWADKHQFYVDNGVSGIWNDMNEPAFFGNKKPLPDNVQELPIEDEQYFYQKLDGQDVGHFELRNLYGLLMSKATRAGLLKYRPAERPFVLTRSAFAGIQNHAAVWLGDNMSWYEHLRNSIPMLLNMGLSGVAYAGVDIGGFGGDASPELLLRWYEQGIFYPFFRNHSIMQSRAQEPWAYGAANESHLRHLIETRYRLLPYLTGLFWEHRRTGAPIMRPLFWHYPDDIFAQDIDDQFLFGRDIMVAPVQEKAKRWRLIYFPEGRWHPFAGGEAIDGPGFKPVEMPLGKVPAFVRDGAILPLADIMQSTADYDKAAIGFYAFGESAEGTYFEDDGLSFDFESAIYNEFKLVYKNGKLENTVIHNGYNSPAREFYLQTSSTNKKQTLSLK